MATKKTGTKTAEKSGKSAPIRVRMYRQGLGDCFLITLPGKSGPFYMVIDCGVVLGTSQEGIGRLTDAVADISRITDKKIDLLVLTHQHWDHVSGFQQAKSEIKDWQVAQVWTAWTEDPRDPLAKKLAAERRQTEEALRMALTRLAEVGERDQLDRVTSLMEFFGAAPGSTEAALNYAKGLAGKNIRFCEPGEPAIELGEVPGIRFYVLGPPKDEKLLRKSDPGKGEAYGLDDGSTPSNAMFINALYRGEMPAGRGSVTVESTLDNPFEDRFQISLSRAKRIPFFDLRYFGDSRDGSLHDRKAGVDIRDQSWRRIDGTWLGTSETLALALDAATNNTSLVLAMEIAETGDVLLFPGDAQAGSWLSWQALKWARKDAAGKEIITTGPDLLARTVFYKVGHHGSHNATLSEKGLELMNHAGLMAMIPVDHEMAVKKRWSKMPLPDLVSRLQERTQGRVLRIDDQATTSGELAAARPAGVSEQDWKAFTARVEVSDLYFEVSI